MGNRILVCGENGAGKSTLGACLAKGLGCPFLDIEDYFFHDKNDYTAPRESREALRALALDMNRYESWVFAARKAQYGPEIEKRFTAAVFLAIPKELGVRRVRQRSFQKFGERICSGGDLYEQENQFLELVKGRSDRDIRDWLNTLAVGVVEIDGAKPVEENIQTLLGIFCGG